MKKLIVLLSLCLIASHGYAQQKPNKDAAINKVLNAFMKGIISKDTATLYSLFAPGIPIGWAEVNSAETVAFARKRNPSATMIEADTHKNFIKFIGTTKDALEEKFYDVKVRHDGSLASVSFNYSFWQNNKKENWGQENWELLYDGSEWKIAAIYFSYNLQSVTPEPTRLQ